jgi:hypothetical protein
VDAGSDAGTDAGLDAGADAGMDAGNDDAGTDAGIDSGVPDSGQQYDDAGCPLPTGIVLDANDAGIPGAALVLWLRADLGVATTDGGQVCRWEDLSGHGNHFVPGTSTPPRWLPTGLNGKPAVSFPATNTWLVRGDVLGIPATDGRTVATILLNHDLTTRFNALEMGQSGTPGTYWGLDANTFQTVGQREGVYVTNNAYDSDVATAAVTRTHVYAISSFAPGGTITNVITYSVGGTVTTLTRTPGGLGNGLVEDFSGANFTVLGAGSPGFAGAEVGDILVFDVGVSSTDRQAIESYLNARYP